MSQTKFLKTKIYCFKSTKISLSFTIKK